MKKLFYLLVTFTLATSACKKDDGDGGGNCNLPSTAVPDNMVGGWVNGYASYLQVIDAYNGKIIGSAWQSGRFLQMDKTGKNAEFYIMAGTQYSQYVTKARGTVTFDADGKGFQFHACSAHYKGWNYGKLAVDREATAEETQKLTDVLQFNYQFETSGGTTWLELFFKDTPGGSPTSFRKAN